MLPKHLNLQILSDNTDFQLFDCGDDDLNDFLVSNAYQSMTRRMSFYHCRRLSNSIHFLREKRFRISDTKRRKRSYKINVLRFVPLTLTIHPLSIRIC